MTTTEPETEPCAVVVVLSADLRNAIAQLPDPDDLDGSALVDYDEQRSAIAEDVYHLVVAGLAEKPHRDDPLGTLAAFADYMARLDASDDTYIEWSDVAGYLPTIVADVHRLTMELAIARERLTDLFVHELGDALVEQAGAFTCTEACDLADIARVSGCGDFADQFMRAHQDHPEHDL